MKPILFNGESMKQILDTLYALGRENAWVAALTVSGALVTVAVVCVLGCMVVNQIRNVREGE